MLRTTSLLLLLAACTSSKDTEPDTDVDTPDTNGQISTCDGDASVTMTLPTGELQGEVEVEVVLTHPTDERADLRLTWSADGDSYDEMTVSPALDNLAVSAGGVTTTLVWDTIADLGYGDFSNLMVKAVASSDSCNPWPASEMEGIAVNNVEVPPPMCAATFQTLEGPVDGMIAIGFDLSREEEATAAVVLQYSTDGVEFEDVTLAAGDCDGDEIPDGPTGLTVGPDGSSHCLNWDSQLDLVTDEEITLQLSCVVDGTTEAMATSDPFTVENDPAPSVGEVVVTELMINPRRLLGQYVELRSTAGHEIDLEGLVINRWDSATSSTAPPDSTFTIDVATDSLLVEPGGHVLLAASDDPAQSGCREPDVVWPLADFALHTDSVLAVAYDGVEISRVDYSVLAFSNYASMECDPTQHELGCADPTAWCQPVTTVSGCIELANPNENGSPGALNATCMP